MIGGILSLMLAVPSATPAEAVFQAGLDHRADAEKARHYFDIAAHHYEDLRQAGADNPDLYLNQGNAAYLAGDPAAAILAYRRGLRIAPTDPELRANLAHVREQVIYPQPGRFARPAIEHRPPWLPRWPGLLLVIGLLLYSSGCLALTRWWMVREGPWRRIGVWCLLIALLPLLGFAWEEWQLRGEEAYPLVVVNADGVRLRKGNGESYPPVVDVPLNRGVEARQWFVRGDWLQVELGSGEIGWLHSTDCIVDQ